MSNRTNRVDVPLETVTGPIFGSALLSTLKSEIIKEPVLQTMFGTDGNRVFIEDLPSLNESIVPCIMARWRQDQYRSNNTYLDGSILAEIVLPTRLIGDFNSLRRVGSIFQRWLGSRCNLFAYPENKGLVLFGFESTFNYEGLAVANGVKCPAIQVNIPFRFDLALLRGDYDPELPLDKSDIGFIKSLGLKVFNEENNQTLIAEGDLFENV